jgi:late competence protein required for DNA uptake (superfamily II DNA/RNA helicase)
MLDDSVQIRCHRCKGTFREKARRLQSGYSRQCISCETMLFFDDASADKNIQRTLREARKIRKALREAEFEKLSATPVASAGREFSNARSTTSGREN